VERAPSSRFARPRAALATFLEATLQVRPGEGRRVALLFVQLLLASSVFVLGRTVRDTLFLSRYPIKYLPWMFVLYGITSALTVVVYARFADRVPRHRLIAGTTAVGITTYLATWGLVRAGQTWIYPAFYVWAEVMANLFVVQFWTLANDLFDARAAKRLFGTIGSARMLGVVLVGLGTGVVVEAIGTAQLLFVLAALMAGIALCAGFISREQRALAHERSGARPRRRGSPPDIARDPYVQALALMILVVFVALTIGDYQFKRIARDSFREDQLARFFSLFYAGAGTVSFLFQVWATPRILARLGVGAGLSVMPAVFGTASAALLAFPSLAVATVMKFADNGFQYAIHETTLQALYVPFAAEVKARTRALLDAVVKPASYGLGGVAIILLTPYLSVPGLSAVSVGLVLLWFASIVLVRRRYLLSLEATLSARGALAFDHEYLLDAAGRQALVRTLERGEPRQVLVALEQLAGEQDDAVLSAVARAAQHPDPGVRTAALYQIASTARGDPTPTQAALADGAADVRAAAAAAHAALAQDESVDALAPLLTDAAPDVRVAALAGLLRHGGVEGGIVGGAELGRLLGSERRDDRIAAARALRHLGTGAYRPVRRLLADPDPAVRRAALKAAPGVRDPRLVPALLTLLRDPAARGGAGTALVAVGAEAATPLAQALDDPATPRAVRLLIPRLLRRIPHPGAYERLRQHVQDPDSHVRLRILAGMARLRRVLNLREPLAFVQENVSRELSEAYANLSAWAAARPVFPSPLLDEEFLLRRRRAIRRVLRLVELRYDQDAMELVRERLPDPARRANALEVLDALLEPPLRPLVMPLVDEATDEQRLARARALTGPPPDPETFMREQCHHPNPFVVLLALEALHRHGNGAAANEGCRLLHHPDPLVREGAALATDMPLPEGQMYSTLEKILLLKRASIFDKVNSEDLAALARVATVAVYAPGETIVREGDAGDALFIIVRGSVGVVHDKQQVASLGPGEPFGEMAVLDREPRSASAAALEETEVLWIGSEEFYEVLHEQVEIAEGVIRMLSNRLRGATAELGRIKRVTNLTGAH
jgi:ATP/ADP translocase